MQMPMRSITDHVSTCSATNFCGKYQYEKRREEKRREEKRREEKRREEKRREEFQYVFIDPFSFSGG
ncbi:hypothetical protein llap_4526 [Limosa lapponica baueri]|uniref:Uncharacterized protein n=1 Tax=Limosa lapponica baueri TaxID=1758121 RepID=A0A2I0UGL1_LIMLA|nr:hypothetical protein llap_4526 [Limosa lapponica baueri]